MSNMSIYKRYRFAPEIISHCVWLYYRFSLSFRDIELMMLEKGVEVTYESIRLWCLKFGTIFSKQIRKNKSFGHQLFLDEVFTQINGKKVYLWRAVDEDGQTVPYCQDSCHPL